MAVLSGVLSEVWNILQSFVPKSVDPPLFYLTFVITMALIFLIMQTLEFFKDNRGVSFIVAFVLAYFTAGSVFVTVLISKLFPNIGLAIMAILGIMLVIVFISPETFKGRDSGFPGTPIIVIAVFIITLWLTWQFAAPELERTGVLDGISGVGGYGVSNEDFAIIIVAMIILGILYFVFKGPAEDNKGKGMDKFLKYWGGRKF